MNVHNFLSKHCDVVVVIVEVYHQRWVITSSRTICVMSQTEVVLSMN